MKQVLIIGAGDFGRNLAYALREGGCCVDILDRNAASERFARAQGCRFFCSDAWNVSDLEGLSVSDYDCCYLCIPSSQPLGLSLSCSVVKRLRQAGAQRVVVRINRLFDAEDLLQAGADEAVCPEYLAGRMLLSELAD